MKKLNLHALGVCASTLCMVHCLAFPLLLTALPPRCLVAQTDDSSTVRPGVNTHLPTAADLLGAESEFVTSKKGETP